jgi:hypothetical protein
MVVKERIQAILRMANPDHFGHRSPVELLVAAELHPFAIAIRPTVFGLGLVVEMVDQLKKHSDG